MTVGTSFKTGPLSIIDAYLDSLSKKSNVGSAELRNGYGLAITSMLRGALVRDQAKKSPLDSSYPFLPLYYKDHSSNMLN